MITQTDVFKRGRHLLDKHGYEDWRIRIDMRPTKRRWGECRRTKKEIGVSRYYLDELNRMPAYEEPMNHLDDLLLHELESVVVEVASQPDGGQDEDLPVVHSRATPLSAGGAVDVPGDRPKDVVAQVGAAVDVLQGPEDGDDFVAAVEIEANVEDRLTIKPLLAIERFSHGSRSSKNGMCLHYCPVSWTDFARKRSHLRGAFFKNSPKNQGRNAFSDGHWLDVRRSKRCCPLAESHHSK
ncbi:MAG TPA: hypothetical protein VMX15_06020 [Candidatus Heimdallarchaeota archaeon]|nr:hypothetical protein [Candidatus Heimdallarchaeota archaeon]